MVFIKNCGRRNIGGRTDDFDTGTSVLGNRNLKRKSRGRGRNPKLKRPKGCEKQRGSESGREAAEAVERTAQRGWKRKRKTRVSRKKQLQRLNPTEDERKLQIITGLDRKVGAFIAFIMIRQGQAAPVFFILFVL